MAKAIFTTRVNPTYDDQPEERYHFPRAYLNQVRAVVGDWIIYYEPRRQGGRQVYFATARLKGIRPDPSRADHFYADIDSESYLDFDVPVPFRHATGLFENALEREGDELNKGAFRRAVRILPDDEYDLILRAGFAPIVAATAETWRPEMPGFEDDPSRFQRPILEHLVRRPFRDAAFTKGVADAYALTCAFTGLKIINGGGRPEIEAAHIQPVGGGHKGPDTIRNGVALSRTVHWMFDRGLLSLDNDFRILKSSKLPEPAKRLLNPDGYIRVPAHLALQPHPRFLRYHRETIFKE